MRRPKRTKETAVKARLLPSIPSVKASVKTLWRNKKGADDTSHSRPALCALTPAEQKTAELEKGPFQNFVHETALFSDVQSKKWRELTKDPLHFGAKRKTAGTASSECIARFLEKPFAVAWDEDLGQCFTDNPNQREWLEKSDLMCRWIDDNGKEEAKSILSSIGAPDAKVSWKGKVAVLQTNQPWHVHLWNDPKVSERFPGTSCAKETVKSFESICRDFVIPNDALLSGVKLLHGESESEGAVVGKGTCGVQVKCGDKCCTGNILSNFVPSDELPSLAEAIRDHITSGSGDIKKVFLTSDNDEVCAVVPSAFAKKEETSSIKFVGNLGRETETHLNHKTHGGGNGTF
eukprot:jgi/Bigna1/76420/fgenesh1_pg.41_\